MQKHMSYSFCRNRLLCKFKRASIEDEPLLRTSLYWGRASIEDGPLLRTNLYWGRASIEDEPLLRTSLYWGRASIEDEPLLRTSLYWGRASIEDESLLNGILNESDLRILGTAFLHNKIFIKKINKNQWCWFWTKDVRWHPNMAQTLSYYAPLQIRKLWNWYSSTRCLPLSAHTN